MKRLVLTFLSTAAVCAVVSAIPAAAQDTVTGAPRGTAPVTVEGYGNSSGSTPVRSRNRLGVERPGLRNRSAFSVPARQPRHPTRAMHDIATLMTLTQGRVRLSAVHDRPLLSNARRPHLSRPAVGGLSISAIRCPSGIFGSFLLGPVSEPQNQNRSGCFGRQKTAQPRC
jgi:hypothetical protein